jgi:predicted DNA-binding protein YlxM (UPF0122 family)
MDDLYKTSLLLDFYGQMLTKRQYETLDLRCNGDYSFGEIAQELEISRQGVYDNIKRGKAALFDMENKLGLVSRFSHQKKRASEILEQLNAIDISVLDQPDRQRIGKVIQEVRNIMED